MLLGQHIAGVGDATPNDVEYFSSWFPRGGNAATFICELINKAPDNGGGEFTGFKIYVQTKNMDEDDAARQEFTGQSITLTKYTKTSWTVGAGIEGTSANTGFKELVRFRYALEFGATGDIGWVHFRMLNPAWLDN